MKSLAQALAALCAVALTGVGAARAQDAPQDATASPRYVVIEEDARIPFASQINGFEVGQDGSSLLLRVGVNRWYRAEIGETCARDLRFEHRLPLIERGGGSISKFAYVRVNGRSCYFYSLDRIENPHRNVASNG